MADVLLTHCNHVYSDPKQARKMQPYPPLQTLLAAAVLRQAGLDVALFDSTLNAPMEGFQAALEQHNPRLVAICEDNFNYLTKMCLTQNRELAFSMAPLAREWGAAVIVNGSDSTDRAAEYLDRSADYLIVGELERTLVELTNTLLGRSPADPQSIAGVAWLDPASRQVRYSSPRQAIHNLDDLPAPAWEMADIEAYRRAWTQAHGFFSLNTVASRGCPYHCNWCARPIFAQSYRVRSPESVAREMRLMKSALAPDQLWFADDVFGLTAKWTRQFADAVERLDARIPFKIQSRCELMTTQTAAALRCAGCCEVWMGAESGSQTVLDAMEKGIEVEDIYSARANLRSEGIRACYFLQFGYPGETWDDIQATIRLVREARPDDIGISVSYPLPNTKFHTLVAAQLGEKKNWRDSDDLAMMFRGTYSSEFYRELRDALHLETDLINNRINGDGWLRLKELWSRVEDMRKTCANPDPTPPWISC
jgi:anaerobic magnesium-protoporphyrin IX monomethyl ester cyclase